MMRNQLIAAIVVTLSIGGSAFAIDRVWDDEGGSADKTWSNAGNWNPDGVPLLQDDVFIGGLANGTPSAAAQNDVVLLDINVFAADSIATLTLTNGADLRTNGFQLTLAGDTVVNEDAGSVILRIDSSGFADDCAPGNVHAR